MKTFLQTLSNTYKAVRLLSNPDVSTYIEHEFLKSEKSHLTSNGLGSKNAIFRKHYIVEVC